MLQVNYRGSTGNGDDGVESLVGHAGFVDVDDCYAALKTCLADADANIDADDVVLYGGSHGGFLAAHMAARYPDAFKAAAMRNPVINKATRSMGLTDNPDADFCSVGLSYDWG